MKPAAIESLASAFAQASARLAPGRTPWRSAAIHAAVLLLWITLLAAGLGRGGLLGWSVGAVYVAYDTLLQGFAAWHCRHLLRPRALAAPGPLPEIGVIIAAHNEAAVLPATVAALLAQVVPPRQILIADDGSNDGTAAVLAARYALVAPPLGGLSAVRDGRMTLAWLRLPHGGKARALNAAILHMETEVVVTVDADTLADPRALGAMAQAFADEAQLVAVTGVITPVCRDTVAGRCLQWFQTYEYIRNFLSRFAWMQVRSLLLISGAFAGFRRQALLAVGGFDAQCLVEDYELSHRLHRHALLHGLDWRIRVLGDAQARTEAPGSIGAFLRQRRRWFGGFLQTQYWYRAMVGDRRFGLLGTLMLPVKAVDTLQPFYGLAAFVLLLVYLATGRIDIVLPAGGVIGAKILVDLAYHAWSVHAYRRWIGDATRASLGWALLAALAEPFSFQLLRHVGAVLGWSAFLGGGRSWGRQTRFGVAGVPPAGAKSTTDRAQASVAGVMQDRAASTASRDHEATGRL